MKIQKPLLAGKFDSGKAKFPYAATPKIDGIRFLMVGGAALTRSFKPIRNETRFLHFNSNFVFESLTYRLDFEVLNL